MSIEKTYQRLANALELYRQKLSEYSEEVFAETPEEGSWSYSEVYAHITSSSYLSLRAAQKCAEGSAEDHPEAAPFPSRLVLLLGRLPKGRKVPASIAKNIEKLSKIEAAEKLQKVSDKLEEIRSMIPNAKANQKLPHPRLGYLDAKQWLKFVNIHCWHHIKQLQRIEAKLGRK